MIPTLKYAWLTIKHKYYVFLAGIRIGCPIWRLITHDLSKFSLKELPYYGNQFFGNKDNPTGFMNCWLHHQNHNDHHWEYWIPRTGHSRCTPPYKDNKPIIMPKKAILEMIADWLGASRSYEGRWPTIESWPWAEKNLDNILKRVHPSCRRYVRTTLNESLCRFKGGVSI